MTTERHAVTFLCAVQKSDFQELRFLLIEVRLVTSDTSTMDLSILESNSVIETVNVRFVPETLGRITLGCSVISSVFACKNNATNARVRCNMHQLLSRELP
jgi:hypothetical protein